MFQKKLEPSHHPVARWTAFGQRSKRSAMVQATIALWGMEKVGKTAFVAALEAASTGEGISIYPADEPTERVMSSLRTRRANHLFPTPSPIPTAMEDLPLLRFGLEPARSKRLIALTIADVGGRWWHDAAAQSHLVRPIPKPHEVLLAACHGLICLLDPTQALQRTHMPQLPVDSAGEMTTDKSTIADAGVELQALLARLRRARSSGAESSPLKIAICLSQMDRPEHYGHLGLEQAYFRRLYGALPFHNWVVAKNLRFFGCSAAGVLQHAGYTISNSFKDQDGQERMVDPTVAPLHLFRPIKWLLGLA